MRTLTALLLLASLAADPAAQGRELGLQGLAGLGERFHLRDPHRAGQHRDGFRDTVERGHPRQSDRGKADPDGHRHALGARRHRHRLAGTVVLGGVGPFTPKNLECEQHRIHVATSLRGACWALQRSEWTPRHR